MEAKLSNTITEIVTASGEKLKGTLNFYLLYGVKKKWPEAYANYNRIMMNGMSDVFDAIDILYTAYLCALPEGDEPIKYEEFMLMFDDDVPGVMKQAGIFLGRKKKASSATRS